MLKKHALFIALGYSCLITFASLVRLNNMPDVGVSFGDKLFHLGAYAVMTWVWFNYFSTKKRTKQKAILVAAIIAALFGMIIEALQGGLTATREADINDIVANNVGVLLAALFIWFLPSKDVKKY